MSVEYDQYLAEHIGNVDAGLHWMMDNLPLNQTQTNAIMDALLTAHDESKFSPEEYEAYDKYFYGGDKSYEVCRAFDQAWLHHQKCNPHHWQYWVLINDDPDDETLTQLKTLPMPLNFIFEMIADWWTFSWRNGNLFEIFSWYGNHRDRMMLHFDTRMIVEDILQKMWKVLVMTEVRRGKDRDELERQYISYWLEEPVEPLFNESELLDIMDTDASKLYANDLKHSDEEDDEDLYGVPELKKFPMPDKKHVKSAIRFFNYVDPKHEQELAKAILEKAEEFGLDLEKDISVGDENRFRKYLKKEES